jgi:hypothetical protein
VPNGAFCGHFAWPSTTGIERGTKVLIGSAPTHRNEGSTTMKIRIIAVISAIAGLALVAGNGKYVG